MTKYLTSQQIGIATGQTVLPDASVNLFREKWRQEGYQIPDWNPHAVHQSSVGTKLHAVILRETGKEIPCPACAKEIDSLNLMTVEEASLERDRVVDGIHSRAWEHAGWQDKLKLAASFAVQAMTVGHVDAAKNIIGGWFDEAIETGAVPAVQKKKIRGRAARAAARRGRSGLVPRTKWVGPPVVECALPDNVRKNLIYHIYPVKKMRWLWQWNLDQILQRIELFNGRKVVGIAHDHSTDPPDAVKEYLSGHGFEFIVEENDVGIRGFKGLGENVTAVKLMEAVQSFESEVTFRAHAKGVSKLFGKPLSDRTENGETVKKWTEVMYAVCLDDWETVRGQLEQFAMTGPFRKLKKLNGSRWYYSGSFYWYEHIRFYQRDWRDIEPRRTGVESLPGRLFDENEVGCLHGDDCGSLYHHTYMVNKVWPQFLEWKHTL